MVAFFSFAFYSLFLAEAGAVLAIELATFLALETADPVYFSVFLTDLALLIFARIFENFFGYNSVLLTGLFAL